MSWGGGGAGCVAHHSHSLDEAWTSLITRVISLGTRPISSAKLACRVPGACLCHTVCMQGVVYQSVKSLILSFLHHLGLSDKIDALLATNIGKNKQTRCEGWQLSRQHAVRSLFKGTGKQEFGWKHHVLGFVMLAS